MRIALDRYYAFVAGTFADAVPGELILYEDSYGLVTLAISSGDAARLTGAVGGRRAADRRHVTPGQRFARVVTTVVVRMPFLWRLFRAPLTRNFDRLAPEWDATRVSRERLAPMVAALESLPDPPAAALDVGTGTGAVARLLSELWPDAEVTGVDASAGMIAEARRLGHERYEVGDASHLPFDDESFDLVTLNNMIPFFDELARVTKPGGLVAVAFSMGAGRRSGCPCRPCRRASSSAASPTLRTLRPDRVWRCLPARTNWRRLQLTETFATR